MWSKLDEPMRIRIIKAGVLYVLKEDPTSESWPNDYRSPSKAMTGYFLFKHLAAEERARLQDFPLDVWTRWAPALLKGACRYDRKWDEIDAELFELVWHHSDSEFLRALEVLLIEESDSFEGSGILERIEYAWGDRLADVLLKQTRNDRMASHGLVRLLVFLINHQPDAAREVINSWLDPERRGPEKRLLEERMAAAAALLRVGSIADAWEPIWKLAQQAADFGEKFLVHLGFVSLGDPGQLVDGLTNDQIANLYVWLEHKYPPNEDPDRVQSWNGYPSA